MFIFKFQGSLKSSFQLYNAYHIKHVLLNATHVMFKGLSISFYIYDTCKSRQRDLWNDTISATFTHGGGPFSRLFLFTWIINLAPSFLFLFFFHPVCTDTCFGCFKVTNGFRDTLFFTVDICYCFTWIRNQSPSLFDIIIERSLCSV